MSRKVLFTLDVDGYAPEITRLTRPLQRFYADKIGAEYCVITERKHKTWPVVMEKLQIYDLARSMGAEWAMFLDADALVHPECIDFMAYLPKDVVAHNGCDHAAVRWRMDTPYFRRDGRNIGSCNWLTMASEWCLDLWQWPHGESPDKIVEHIRPILDELNTVITPDHLMDDYILSRNIARYGLKFSTVGEIVKRAGLPGANYLWHEYTIAAREKVRRMRNVLALWAAPDSILPRDLWQWDGWDKREPGPNGGTVLSVPCPE